MKILRDPWITDVHVYVYTFKPFLMVSHLWTGGRDKDSEVRDDPTKYYLLDPATMAMNNSPCASPK